MKELTAKLGKISPVIVTTPKESLDITPLVVGIEITESLFNPFIKGSIILSEPKSIDVLKGKRIPTDLTAKIQFSFSGKEDDGETNQKEIVINAEDYLIYKIVPGTPYGPNTQLAELYFAHKHTFHNTILSKSFKKKKIHEIVSSLAEEIELKIGEIEPTEKTFNFALPYRTALEHIMFLSSHARREENPKDVNYVFYQDLKGKHNFVSVGKLMSQTPFNTKNDSFYFGFNAALDFKTARRSMLKMTAKESNQFQNAINGMHSSAIMTLDLMSKVWEGATFFLPSFWKKQTHLSGKPTVDPSSEFYNYIHGAASQRFYSKSRHSHCCKEHSNCNNKIGGEDDWLLPRISSMEQINQYSVLFTTTGFSDINKLCAGKTFYVSRPYVDTGEGTDMMYSGKFLATTITHRITRDFSSGKYEYVCDINGVKDSIGEE